MPIDVKLEAQPEKITASANDIGSLKTAVTESQNNIVSAKSALSGQDGYTPPLALAQLSKMDTACTDLVSDLDSYKTALDDFAGSMTSVKNRLQAASDKARNGGLEVMGEKIIEPKREYQERTSLPTPSTDQYHIGQLPPLEPESERKIELYQSLDGEVSEIRDTETEARQKFSDACAAITSTPLDNPVAKTVTGFLFPSLEGGGLKSAASFAKWGIGRLRNANSLLDAYALKNSNGRFSAAAAQKNSNRFLKWLDKSESESVGKFKGALEKGKLANWEAGEGAGSKALDFARKAGKGLKWTGRVSNVISFATSAADQWSKDSHNPSIGEGEKITRATVKGGLTAGGGWAGGVAGAQAGAAIGALGGPVGAAVGGIVGGVVGGAIGSGAGSALADGFNSLTHKLFH